MRYHESHASWYDNTGTTNEPVTRSGPDGVVAPTGNTSPSTSGVEGRSFDQSQPAASDWMKQQVGIGQSASSRPQDFNVDEIASGLADGPVFLFPTIEHVLYAQPVLLKAHSSFDLSETDPEIFAILQAAMTPYLQTLVGHTLQAYTLEVDYSPGHEGAADDVIVTNLRVMCTLKVVSDSLKSLTMITHQQVGEWMHDFFAGEEALQLLDELRRNNINVNEIVFADQDFKSPVVDEINGEGGSSSSSSSPNDNDDGKSGNAGVVIGVTMAIIFVGLVLYLHFTGRLPSKERLGELGSSLRDSLSSGSRSGSHRSESTRPFVDEDGLNKEGRGGRGRRIWAATIGRLYSFLSGNGNYDNSGDDDDEEGGRRRRTFSGTFRRFPTGGLRPAAIQKRPAQSKDYLKNADHNDSNDTSKSSISQPPSSSSSESGGDVGAGHEGNRKPFSSAMGGGSVANTMDDYSFSCHKDRMGEDYDVDGDYGPSGSPRSPTCQTSSGRLPTRYRDHGDEFSMPDDYDTVTDDHQSVYSRWSQSVMTLSSFMPRPNGQRNSSRTKPSSSVRTGGGGSNPNASPASSPRRVTPSDIASPNEYGGPRGGGAAGDEWSLDSFTTGSPSARRPQQALYREWGDDSTPSSPRNSKKGHANGTSPSSGDRFKLTIPRFA